MREVTPPPVAEEIEDELRATVRSDAADLSKAAQSA
jgi:hypothetical protein